MDSRTDEKIVNARTDETLVGSITDEAGVTAMSTSDETILNSQSSNQIGRAHV